jgi:hypothetical protein
MQQQNVLGAMVCGCEGEQEKREKIELRGKIERKKGDYV